MAVPTWKVYDLRSVERTDLCLQIQSPLHSIWPWETDLCGLHQHALSSVFQVGVVTGMLCQVIGQKEENKVGVCILLASSLLGHH